MEIRQPLSSRSLSANEKRGGQDNWDGAKRADDQGHWAEEEREKVRVWEDKGAETKDNGEGFPSDGDKKKPSVRSTKKRHLPAAGEKPPLGRRIKRHRFTSPLPSDEEEEFEGGYVLEGKIIAERKMAPFLGPHRGRPRKQYLVQSWKEAPYLAPPLLEDWRNRRRAKAYSAIPLEDVQRPGFVVT